MPKWCEGCPNRFQAMMAEEVGAEKTAAAIRDAGCSWWQALPVNRPDGTPDIVDGCLRMNLRQYLDAYGSDVLLASDTIQEDRNEQAKALRKVQAAIEEHGGGPVLQALGLLGLVTAQAGLQENARPGALPEAGEEESR